MPVKFVELNEKVQIGRCTIPQAVFVTQNPDDETTEQVIERQEKFLKLSEPIKDKLVSSETAEKIKAIGAHYKLELLQMAPIARVIRSYYFGEAKLEDFAQIIEKESKIGKEESENIARYVIDRIIQKNVQAAPVTPTAKMTLAQAIEKYPEIQEQLLTSTSIEVAGQSTRPTIKNWTTDYFNAVGAGNRDIMKRSSYLYHSKNVKNLNALERQKLSTILKSLDEGFMLRVDTDKKEVIFDSAPAVMDKSLNRPGQAKSAVDINKKVEQPVVAKPIVLAPKDEEKKDLDKKELTVKPVVVEKPEPIVEKSPAQRESLIKENRIQHVQGNNWDLKSSHFIKRDEFDSKLENNNNDQENIKFSSPQQLPVEKEKDLTKPDFGDRKPTGGRSLKNFFGRIGPIE